MTFKDASNVKSNQTRSDRPDQVVHLSNLCTEIIEVTDADTSRSRSGIVYVATFALRALPRLRSPNSCAAPPAGTATACAGRAGSAAHCGRGRCCG